MKRFSIVVGVFVALVFSASAFAQDLPTGSYPYFLMSKRPLPVRTPVWANLGDSECAYPIDRSWPRGDDKCFQDGGYMKARIKAVLRVCTDFPSDNPHPCWRWAWAYQVEFDFLVDGGRRPRSTWNGGLDNAFKFVNLPTKWAEWSEYFIQLNW